MADAIKYQSVQNTVVIWKVWGEFKWITIDILTSLKFMTTILFNIVGGVYQIYSLVHKVIGYVITLTPHWYTHHWALDVGHGLSYVQYLGERTCTILDMIKMNVSPKYCSSFIFGWIQELVKYSEGRSNFQLNEGLMHPVSVLWTVGIYNSFDLWNAAGKITLNHQLSFIVKYLNSILECWIPAQLCTTRNSVEVLNVLW